MFELTLVDHLRLTFGHVVYRHKTHTQLARLRALQSRWLRAAEAVLMTAVAAAAVAAAFRGGRAYPMTAAILAGITVLVLLVHLTFDFDETARAHAACASRLWLIRERYRAVMSDLSDGAIDLESARRRRDGLMDELHAIYEEAPTVDLPAYKAAGDAVTAVDETALKDEEIDIFLPKSLQKVKSA